MPTALGFPGKMGISGARVWDAYLAGEIESIRNDCESDVLNTFLVYQHDIELLKDTLKQEDKSHVREFLDNWVAG